MINDKVISMKLYIYLNSLSRVYQNLKIAKFSTREIGHTCQFARFDTREKPIFKKKSRITKFNNREI